MLFRSSLFAIACLGAFAFASSAAGDSLAADSAHYNGYFQIGTDFNFGLNGGPTDPTFAVDTAEYYGKNWRGLRVPLENGRSYERGFPFLDGSSLA